MGVRISTHSTLPASTQTVTLDGTQYRLRLVWRHRCAAWYMDLRLLDGTPLVTGKRLSAGWSPLGGLVIEDGPPGMFFVRGGDGYEQADLGTSLMLMYYSQAEMQAVVAASGNVAPGTEDVTFTL